MLLETRSSLSKGTDDYKNATKSIKKRVQYLRNEKLRRLRLLTSMLHEGKLRNYFVM